jgi:2-oxoglutarate dehydrogenase E2 component (dihydrolipoamide succinyltransferase)
LSSEQEESQVVNIRKSELRSSVNDDLIAGRNSSLSSEKDMISDDKEQIANRFISPFIRTIALQEHITNEELTSIVGSGKDHRITKDDILQFIEDRVDNTNAGTEQVKQQGRTDNQASTNMQKKSNEDVEYVELSRMRKMIAANMLRSTQISPHVSSFVEVNVTKLVQWRNKVKDMFRDRYQENLTYLPIFIEAVVQALKKYPVMNASLEGGYLVLKKNIHIGIATALPDGNLIVPVISKADTLDLPGLTIKMNDLTRRAKESSLLPSEIQGGTFTITNVGSVGNTGGTPIIRQPELAILAIGSINKKPVAVKIGDQYGVAIADIVELWLSYDHRMIDGALGGSFLTQIARYLEDFNDLRMV